MIVEALLDERRGYVGREDKRDRLAAVDAELAKFGVAVHDDGTVEGHDVQVDAGVDGEPEREPAGDVETTDGKPDKSRRQK